MLTNEESIKNIKKEQSYLETILGVKRIGVFGSYSKGIQTEDRDVDIIVEFERHIGLIFTELSGYIENLLGKKVYVLTSASINSIKVKKVGGNK